MFSSRGIRILLHVAGWMLFFGLIIASSAINRANSVAELFSPSFLLFYATYIFLFYLNTKVLLPRLYLQKRYGLYLLLMVCLLTCVALLQPFEKIIKGQRQTIENDGPQQFPPDGPPSFRPHPSDRFRAGNKPLGRQPGGPQPLHVDIVSIVLFITVWAVSLALALFRQWQQTERRATQAELERATAELSFLKAQINPHFLFNTLNNIYSLAVERSDRAPTAIMKLSNIMRYVTDEARQDFVSLQDEVACITDYIALQQLRLTDKTAVEFTATGDYETLQIAPLVLMPFVENVFKYGVSAHQPSVIAIQLTIQGKNLQFFCRNEVLAAQAVLERIGIGIENTRLRLQHLYPERHALSIQKEAGTFTVQLNIQL